MCRLFLSPPIVQQLFHRSLTWSRKCLSSELPCPIVKASEALAQAVEKAAGALQEAQCFQCLRGIYLRGLPDLPWTGTHARKNHILCTCKLESARSHGLLAL